MAGLGHTASSSPEDVQLARQLQRGYKEWTQARFPADRLARFGYTPQTF